MPRRTLLRRGLVPLLLLLLLLLLSLTLSASLLVDPAAAADDPARSVAPSPSDDPVAIVDAQLRAVAPVTAQGTPDAALRWLDRVGEILSRVASGALPSLPPSTTDAVQTLGAEVLGPTSPLAADARVLSKTADVLPSLWAAGFFYATRESWEPVLAPVATALTAACHAAAKRQDPRPYDALVNAISQVVRFTKDNVFLDGVDRDPHAALPSPVHGGFVVWLAQLVASLSRLEGVALSAAQLRAYMNTLPSKRDGMDTSAAFPVFVDTAKYKASDAAALRAFLAATPPAPNAATQ